MVDVRMVWALASAKGWRAVDVMLLLAWLLLQKSVHRRFMRRLWALGPLMSVS